MTILLFIWIKVKQTNVYSINYVFGKKLAKMNDNLAMIELKYNEATMKFSTII